MALANRRFLALAVPGALLSLLVGALLLHPAAPARADAARVAGGTPVVVALYTSEGCSSCPPADVLLTRLERSQPVAGARIVPLEIHVDYWDAIGWKDPFSSADFTARQTTSTAPSTTASGVYRWWSAARSHGSNHLYTPEAVVDGAVDVVGSDEDGLKKLVAEAARRPKVPLRASFGGKGLVIDVPAFAGPAAATVRVAWVQSQASVAVPRGENGGRTLEHTAIVRQLATLGTVAPAGGRLETTAPGDASLYAVVLLETAEKNETLGVAVVPR
jgi:hypothetical protein